jgi:hypothetical protein
MGGCESIHVASHTSDRKKKRGLDIDTGHTKKEEEEVVLTSRETFSLPTP